MAARVQRNPFSWLLLVVLTLANVVTFVPCLLFAMYMTGGGDSGWGNAPIPLGDLLSILAFAAAPVLQIVGIAVCWVNARIWRLKWLVLCVLGPILYQAALLGFMYSRFKTV